MTQGTVYLDPRVGPSKKRQRSHDLAEPLRHLGFSVRTRTLNSADIAFLAHDGLRIGIEIKTFGDFYASFRKGRLAGHQLRELVKDYDRRYLIIEGVWRPMPGGLVALRRGRLWRTSWFQGGHGLRFNEMDGHLLTLEERAATLWRRSTSRLDTIMFIASIIHWWTSKGVNQHRSHLAFHREVDPALFSKTTLTKLWAKDLPGVGWDRATAIDKHFPSAQALALADEKTWRAVPGIGKTLARRVVAAIEEETKRGRRHRACATTLD